MARTDEEKAALAKAWFEARARRSMTQEAFAQFHGVSTRSLRSYARAFSSSSLPIEQARQVIVSAITALEEILMGLDASAAESAGPLAGGVDAGTVAAPAAGPADTLPIRVPPAEVPISCQAAVPLDAAPAAASSPPTPPTAAVAAASVPTGNVAEPVATARRPKSSFWDDLGL